MPVAIKAKLDLSSVSEVKKGHQDLVKELNDFTEKNPIKIKYDDTVKSFKGLGDGFEQVTRSNNNFSDSMGRAIKRTAEYSLAITGVYGALNQVKDGFEGFSQLDTRLSNISSITGESKANLTEQSKLWNKVAVDMRTTTDVVAQSQEMWMRSGKSISESNEYLKTNIMLSKLSGENSDFVADKLIKVGKAFGHTATQTSEFAGKLALLDTETSSDTSALLRASNGIAEIGKQSKISENYLLSLIATISERSGKAPESVARSIKSILLDLTKVTNAVDEEGKNSLSKFESFMAKHGLAIRKSATEFKSSEEILKTLAENWGNFNEIEQRSIQSLVGGKNFSEEFSIIMNDQNRVLELNNKLKDTGTYLQDKYALATDNVKDSTQQLKAKMEGLWLNLLDSGAIQGAIGHVGHLVDVLKFLTIESPKVGLGFAAMVGTVIFAVKNFTAFTKTLESTIFFFKMLPLALSTSGGLVELLSIQFKGLTSVLTTLTMTPAGAIFMALASAVAVASAVISHHVAYQEDLAEKTKESKKTVEDLDKAMQSLNKNQISLNLGKMQDDFKKLDELKKKKEDIEKRMNEWTLNPVEIGKRILPINAFELREVKEEIEKLETSMKNGGETTEKYAQANKMLEDMNIADAIKEATKQQYEQRESLKNLYSEYMNLNSIENKNADVKGRMTQIANELKDKIGATTETLDENGNVIITNTDLVGKNVDMLNVEGMTLESLTAKRLDDMKQNRMVQANMTSDTYANVKARVAMMKEEMGIATQGMDDLEAKYKAGTITEEENKRYNSMITYAMSKSSSIANFEDAMSKIDKIYSIPANTRTTPTLDTTPNHIPTNLQDGKKGSNNSKQEVEDYKLKLDLYKKEEQQLKNVNREKEKYNLLEQLSTKEKDLEYKQKEIDLIVQESTINDKLTQKKINELNAVKDLLSQFGFDTQNGQVNNALERLQEMTNYSNSLSGEQKKLHIQQVKDLEEQVSKFYELQNALDDNSKKYVELVNNVNKIKLEIIDINLLLKEDSIKSMVESSKELNSQVNMISTDDNLKGSTLLTNMQKKIILNQDLLKISTQQNKVYTDAITYLEKQLTETEQGSKAWDEINNKLISYKDKLRQGTEEIQKQNDVIKQGLQDLIMKKIELATYDGKSRKEWEYQNKQQQDALRRQLEEMRKAEEARKEQEERANKIKEITQVQNQLEAIRSGKLKQMTEEQAKALGLEQERKKILDHELWVKEQQLKIDNIMNNKNVQLYSKDKMGNWDFSYTYDQDALNSLQKEMADKTNQFDKDNTNKIDELNKKLKDKQEEFNKWEQENLRKHNEEKIQAQIEALQKDLDMRSEFMERTKEKLIEYMENEKLQYTEQGIAVNKIVNDTMTELNKTYVNGFNTIKDSITSAINEINQLMAQLGSAQSGLAIASGGANIVGFNEQKYLEANPDVKAELERGSGANGEVSAFKSGLEHFIQFGKNEGRVPQFAEGGKTGNWNDSKGRLAKVDPNELILDRFDTGKIINADRLLQGIDFSRGILEKVDMLKNIPNMVINNAKEKAGDIVYKFENVTWSFPEIKSGNDAELLAKGFKNFALQHTFQNK